MKRLLALFLLIVAQPAMANSIIATRNLPPQSLIAATDIGFSDNTFSGAATDPSMVVGMETRTAIYAGRPISLTDIGFPAIVDRNAVITLIYQQGGVTISTDGRALDRAAPGDLIRVMNLNSRTTVTARIGIDGAGYVAF